MLQGCTPPLERAALKCEAMLRAKAYVHQYEQYGLQGSSIKDAMLAVQDVVAAYNAM